MQTIDWQSRIDAARDGGFTDADKADVEWWPAHPCSHLDAGIFMNHNGPLDPELHMHAIMFSSAVVDNNIDSADELLSVMNARAKWLADNPTPPACRPIRKRK